MFNQFIFEIKKIVKDKLYIAILAITVALFLIPLIAMPDRYSNIDETAELEAEISLTEEGIRQMEEANAALAVKDETERLDLLKNLLQESEGNDSSKKLEAKLAYEEKFLEQMEAGSRSGIPIIEQRKVVAELDYLVKNNLSYLETFSSSTPGANYISNIFQGFFPFIMIMIIPVVICSHIFSAEKNKETEDFMNMTPLSYKILVSSKIMVSIGYSIFNFFIAIVISFVAATLKNGPGMWNYPIPRSEDGIHVDVITTADFLVKVSILLLVIIVFISCLSILISRFTDNFFINLFVLLIILVIPSTPIFSPDSALTNIAHYIPLTYFDISKVLLYGNEYMPRVNQQVNFMNGLLSLSVFSIIAATISGLLINIQKRL
ncbi:ABC transporter permease [Marinilactibacillus kalidii]|uniref:ABC transporter permease n=1 Tax=Marinilactibacillus kalidii TaxID=2820274 RepID=UPI001ABEC3EE|nr:ABC transporter permease [Marinilactibacillus kalidii]